jgi:heat shock protein HslJ
VQHLQAYDWSLSTVVDQGGEPSADWSLQGQRAVQLHFEGQQLSVRNLCNLLNASFTTDGSRLQVTQPASTMRACADQGLMDLEQKVAQQLPNMQNYEVFSGEIPTLVLHWADGSRWELKGTPTPQTKYGSAPERVFLEVAPQRVACSPQTANQPNCLRVREIEYADSGVKAKEGPWHVFFFDIEGYNHETGVRNVLRIDRYKCDNPSAGALPVSYVLDMVVESEQVQ